MGRLDRYGDPINYVDEQSDETPALGAADRQRNVNALLHQNFCRDGWLIGRPEDEDQPRGCPVCRPHLAQLLARSRGVGSVA